MPGRRKTSKAATTRWEKRKGKFSPSNTSNKPKKLRQWSDESKKLAMKEARDGTMSTIQATKHFGVPPSKLKDRMSSRVKPGTSLALFFTEAEEEELVVLLKKCAPMGYGKTKREVFGILQWVV